MRKVNILWCSKDENGGKLGEGQSDSPYLITMSLITIPRVEYYTILSHLNSNILSMQVRSPCKWVCYPLGYLLLVWRYYISRSQALLAHVEGFRRKNTTTTVQMSRNVLPPFAICVRYSSPQAKQGILSSDVFFFF